MGLLDKLWDDTVAGPQPEKGLSKLRKHLTFSSRQNSGKELDSKNGRLYGDELSDGAMSVTRSIMIIKPPGNQGNGSVPVSPAGSTPPVSPFSGGGRFRRRSASDVYERSRVDGPRSPPPPYDV